MKRVPQLTLEEAAALVRNGDTILASTAASFEARVGERQRTSVPATLE